MSSIHKLKKATDIISARIAQKQQDREQKRILGTGSALSDQSSIDMKSENSMKNSQITSVRNSI